MVLDTQPIFLAVHNKGWKTIFSRSNTNANWRYIAVGRHHGDDGYEAFSGTSVPDEQKLDEAVWWLEELYDGEMQNGPFAATPPLDRPPDVEFGYPRLFAMCLYADFYRNLATGMAAIGHLRHAQVSPSIQLPQFRNGLEALADFDLSDLGLDAHTGQALSRLSDALLAVPEGESKSIVGSTDRNVRTLITLLTREGQDGAVAALTEKFPSALQ